MWQLFDKIGRKVLAQEYPPPGGPSTPAGAIATDWGNYIWGYVTNLYGTSWSSERQDRANKEVAEQNRQVRELDIKRIKEQANSINVPYQSLIKGYLKQAVFG